MSQRTEPTGPRHFAELDAYRGIAALCIVTYHAYQYSREAVGLSAYAYEGLPLHALFAGLHMSGVFFVLSGFLLFLPFARAAIAQNGPRSARSFLVRRLIRILPLYYLTLLVVWAWRFIGQPEQLVDLLLHLTFTHTFHERYIFWTIGPAWSLAVELHLYLLLAGFGPLIYLLCGRLATARQRLLLIGGLIGVMIAGSVLYKAWAFTSPLVTPTSWPVYYSLPAKLDAAGLGMLLALLVAARPNQPRSVAWAAWPLRLAGLGVIAATLLFGAMSEIVRLYHSTLMGVGAALLISSTTLAPRGSAWERALRAGPLRFLGTISYGIYLLHEPLLIELGRAGLLISPDPAAFPSNTLILIALSILAASLSYHLIEQPCNELRFLFDHSGRLVARYPRAHERFRLSDMRKPG